jgi:transcriptional regulator with XRE-family HTH domain
MNVGSIGEYIRQQREQAKISLRQLSSAAGVSNPYLSQIERGLRRPSAEILQQIAKGLRISAEALYVQAGILEDRRPDSGVRTAVLADQGLTERQKQVLLEIYESFRKETAEDAGDGEFTGEDDAGPDGAESDGMVPGAGASATAWAAAANEAAMNEEPAKQHRASRRAGKPGAPAADAAGPDAAG